MGRYQNGDTRYIEAHPKQRSFAPIKIVNSFQSFFISMSGCCNMGSKCIFKAKQPTEDTVNLLQLFHKVYKLVSDKIRSHGPTLSSIENVLFGVVLERGAELPVTQLHGKER